VKRTSFYPGGPERGRQDVTPAEEVAECRRILGDPPRCFCEDSGAFDALDFCGACIPDLERYERRAVAAGISAETVDLIESYPDALSAFSPLRGG
jgi:hypothetical protein